MALCYDGDELRLYAGTVASGTATQIDTAYALVDAVFEDNLMLGADNAHGNKLDAHLD